MLNHEYVIIVNEQDQALGLEEKLKAHQLGLLHRAFSIFVYRKVGEKVEFLLQQRHADKYHCGGLWTNACCSHPRVNETILEASKRRLKEELSLELPLTQLGSFLYKTHFENGLTEHEFDHVLIAEYDPTQPIILNPIEVQAIQWVTPSQLHAALESSPALYTPWLKPALQFAEDYVCSLSSSV